MIINSFYTLIATLSFGILSNIRGKNLFFASIGGALTWFFYLLTHSYFHISNMFSFFIASAMGAVYSEIMARVKKTPVTTFVICSIIPLVPGGGMYNTMFEVVQGNINNALILGLKTLSIAGIIAVGVFFVSSISKTISLFRKKIFSNITKK
ncbi:threonine/serine exporter [Clostridium fermenticellae]|uniref:Threonine/serine exporter n=1 Tax=Clostridium fermenticellae TaxID=2068654 RepID=A0A386H6S4_9CLOT|nr:threonine/serine exporter family protein [Clostridium fermenticellae]AYD41471.1 threonine/serine exporter [Clostridium fermenticellae]